MHGKTTLAPEITAVTKHGMWLLLPEGNANNFSEYFISFDAYPEFRSATIQAIQNFVFHQPDQLHWPDLEIDIDLGSLKNPDDFPLRFKGNTG